MRTMEFISNLIKRPISLPLNESAEQINTNTSSSIERQEHHYSSNHHNAIKIKPTNNNNKTVKTNRNNLSPPPFDCFDNSLPSLLSPPSPNNRATITAMANGSATMIDVGACGDSTPIIGSYEHESSISSHYLQSSSSSNSTSNTIEELLIQINDNLNQASMEDISDNDFSPNEYLSNELPSGLMLTPTATKLTTTNKLPSQTSHFPSFPTTVTTSSVPIPLSPTAGSALIESNASVNKFRIDSESESGRNSETQAAFNNSSATKKTTSNKFMGLTEFVESKVPEISTNLNANTEDQRNSPLKTFEEDLIPTLTASARTNLNSTIKTDGGTTAKMLQVVNYETDLSSAVSSDNETYAECQPFLDLVSTNKGGGGSLSINDFECDGDTATSISDGDTYRSALNSYINATLNIPEADEQENNDATMENVEELSDEFIEPIREGTETEECWQNLPTPSSNSTKVFSLTKDLVNRTFDGNEDEPMDVSIIEILESPQVEISPLPNSALLANKPILPLESSVKTPENASTQNCLTFSINKNIKQQQETSTLFTNNTNKQFLGDKPIITRSTVSDGINGVTQNLLVNDTADVSRKNSFSPDSINAAGPEVKQDKYIVAEVDQVSANQLESAWCSLGTLVTAEMHNRLTFSITNENTETVQNESSDVNAIFSKPTNNPNLIQDCSIDSATDTLLPVAPVGNNECSAALKLSPSISGHGNVTQVITSTETESAPQNNSPCEKVLDSPPTSLSSSSTSAVTVAEVHLNSNLSINTSMETVAAAAVDAADNHKSSSLLSFPLKPIKDNKQFPQSPPLRKSSIFLEKSDYSPNKNNAAKTPSPQSDTKNVENNSSDGQLMAGEQNLDDTRSMGSLTSSSISQNSSTLSAQSVEVGAIKPSCVSQQPILDFTFDGSNAILSPAMSTSSSNELETKFATDRRRTFNISCPPNSKSENSPNQIQLISHEISNVVTPPAPPPLTTDTTMVGSSVSTESKPADNNDDVEAIDVDSSMQYLTIQQTSSPTIVGETVAAAGAGAADAPIDSCTSSKLDSEMLSAKEQIKSNVQDEKDIVVENSLFSADQTKIVNHICSSSAPADSSQTHTTEFSDNFQSNLILNPSDFDYLLTKGNTNVEIDRSSLLLRFDPLLGVPVPVNQYQQQQQQQPHPQQSFQKLLAINNNHNNNNNNLPCLSPTLEEDDQQSNEEIKQQCVNVVGDEKRDGSGIDVGSNKVTASTSQKSTEIVQSKENPTVQQDSVQFNQQQQQQEQQQQEQRHSQDQSKTKKNARMSVDVIKDIQIENDCKKSIECSNSTQSDAIQNNFKMDELEKKIKNEVLKTEDIEKKLKEAEQREEALIKRITEKDKTISKMNGVIEAYEKAIAELISEKEQLIQNYEKQLADVKADRDSNYHHLTSLETTFSDLHVKYEKSKEMTSQLKTSEESLLVEKKQNLENLRLQEQRYEKMKNHAMQQLEIANKKLESLTKEHAMETTKLKALLKKEEISKASINEQLAQKARENAELVKICDELINGQGS